MRLAEGVAAAVTAVTERAAETAMASCDGVLCSRWSATREQHQDRARTGQTPVGQPRFCERGAARCVESKSRVLRGESGQTNAVLLAKPPFITVDCHRIKEVLDARTGSPEVVSHWAAAALSSSTPTPSLDASECSLCVSASVLSYTRRIAMAAGHSPRRSCSRVAAAAHRRPAAPRLGRRSAERPPARRARPSRLLGQPSASTLGEERGHRAS